MVHGTIDRMILVAINPDHDSRSGFREFFTGLFISYCDSYRQPRIKRDDPQSRFEVYLYRVAIKGTITRHASSNKCTSSSVT